MSRVDAAERLLHLIIALTHAQVRMTRSEIRARVRGYEPADASWDEATTKKKDASFERMFERDKDDLRRMGVPIVTVTDAAHGDDIGYRIDASESRMGELELTSAELAALTVAAGYWRDTERGEDATIALTKVATHAPAGAVRATGAGEGRLGSKDAVATFVDAINTRQRVRFTYDAASSGTAVRTVEPWLVRFRGAAEYVIAFDVDKQEQRSFRLNRIASKVAHVGEPGAFSVPDVLPEPERADAAAIGEAEVCVAPGEGYSLRARASSLASMDDGWDRLVIPYVQLERMRDHVISLAGSAYALTPQELVDDIGRYAMAASEVKHG